MIEDGPKTYTGPIEALNRTSMSILNIKQTVATIASGAILFRSSKMMIDTEDAAASDNLDTINGGTDGDLLVLSTADSGRDVTIRDTEDNIRTAGNFVMDDTDDTITLYRRGGVWFELSRSDNV